MKNNFSFLQFSNVITGVVSLPVEAKEKRNPFIIVNTDNDRGLYIVKLEKELAKYKGLKSETGDTEFHDIETSNLIVFGDNTKFDYRTEMNYLSLNSLIGRDVKVYDIVEDYAKIVRRLATYCKNNGIKRRSAYRDCCNVRVDLVVEEPRVRVACPRTCPLLSEKTLVNIYSRPKPNVTVEDITVHANWVKIGYNQYDIYVDLCGNEFIVLEDGTKMFVKADRFGRRYLTA